jgi:predicted secreted protein
MNIKWHFAYACPAILALAVFLAPFPARAQNELNLGQLEPGQIALNLNLTEQRRVEQDTLNATLEYTVQGSKRVELQDEVNKAMGMTLELLRGTTGIEFNTGRYQVSIVPADRPARGDVENPVWRARQSVQLSSQDSEALLAVTGQLQEAGLALNGLYYSLSPALHETLVTQDRASTPLNYTSYLDGQNGGSG